MNQAEMIKNLIESHIDFILGEHGVIYEFEDGSFIEISDIGHVRLVSLKEVERLTGEDDDPSKDMYDDEDDDEDDEEDEEERYSGGDDILNYCVYCHEIFLGYEISDNSCPECKNEVEQVDILFDKNKAPHGDPIYSQKKEKIVSAGSKVELNILSTRREMLKEGYFGWLSSEEKRKLIELDY